jgi:vacuolar-type H+-ATPase subunit B/Vma2
MSNIAEALKTISSHREVVPVYYHRRSGTWIITGLSKTHGGAVRVNDRGQIVSAFASKRAALRSIDTK